MFPIPRAPTPVPAIAIVLLMLSACRTTPQLAPSARKAAEADSLARSAIQNERSLDPARLAPTSVGILPLRVVSDDSALTPLGYGLAALLYTDLACSARLTLVERLRTDAVVRELKLAASGAVDPATAPRVGNLSGARRLVLGSVTIGAAAPGDRGHVGRRAFQIDTRVADVATGGVVDGDPGRASLDQLLDAEKALAFRLFDLLGVTLTPRERAFVEQRPTRSLVALLAFSRGMQAEAMRDYATAARQYARAVRLDPGFAAARTQLRQVVDPTRASVEPATPIQRATAATTEAVNRPLAPVAGSAADAPLQAVQQNVTITVRVGVP